RGSPRHSAATPTCVLAIGCWDVALTFAGATSSSSAALSKQGSARRSVAPAPSAHRALGARSLRSTISLAAPSSAGADFERFRAPDELASPAVIHRLTADERRP